MNMEVAQRNENIYILDHMKPGTKFQASITNPYDRAVIRNGCLIDPGEKMYRCEYMEDGRIFVYGQKRRRYGWYWEQNPFLNTFRIVPPKDEEAEWHKRCAKAEKKLEKSGLWPELKELYRNLQQVSLDDLKAIRTLPWGYYYCNPETGKTEPLPDEKRTELYRPWADRYPFIFRENADGNLNIDVQYVYELADCQLKPMYFGKLKNADVKKQFAEAMASGQDYTSGKIQVSYDVSLRYSAEAKKAFYDEEYRDCGNGHYYLALDANTAVFCEND